jgi:hypothetical protein
MFERNAQLFVNGTSGVIRIEVMIVSDVTV